MPYMWPQTGVVIFFRSIWSKFNESKIPAASQSSCLKRWPCTWSRSPDFIFHVKFWALSGFLPVQNEAQHIHHSLYFYGPLQAWGWSSWVTRCSTSFTWVQTRGVTILIAGSSILLSMLLFPLTWPMYVPLKKKNQKTSKTIQLT